MVLVHVLRCALLVCGVFFLLLPTSALAQDYGSGWFGVAEGMRQNLGQQEALRDRMRISKAARLEGEKNTAKAKAANVSEAGVDRHQATPSGLSCSQPNTPPQHVAQRPR